MTETTLGIPPEIAIKYLIDQKNNGQIKTPDYYLRIAYEIARDFSTDLNTQVGAVLVNGNGEIVAWGANRFPSGVLETPDRKVSDKKLQFVVHAENYAILQAARNGVRTKGLDMYGTWVSCNDCAKAIIVSGIRRVIGHKKTDDASSGHWLESIKTAREMFKEAGVDCSFWDGNIGGIEILFNGAPFRP